jgi:hypothetical protein
MSRRTINILWLIAYLVTMAGLVWGVVSVRGSTVADLSRPESLAQWRQWKEDTQRQTAEGKSSPVARKPVNSDEPPSLILMRDYFPAILAVALLVASFSFGFLMVLVRGVWASGRKAALAGPPEEPAS